MLASIKRHGIIVVLTISFAGFLYPVGAADIKVEDIITKHLDSVGTPETRAAVSTRAMQGALRFKILVGGAGEATGSWGRVSDHNKSNFVMKFGSGNWHGEQIVCDGEKASFTSATATHDYSDFAKFVSGQDFVVKEGLLGGELSTAFALENLDPNRAKLEYLGLKKIDGHELYGIGYTSKSGAEMTVKLYFDPQTFHHVKTVYSALVTPRGTRITTTAFQQELRYTLEERFSDFKTENGITLPHRYDLQYTEELQSGSTRIYDWDMSVDKISENIGLDPANFVGK